MRMRQRAKQGKRSIVGFCVDCSRYVVEPATIVNKDSKGFEVGCKSNVNVRVKNGKLVV